MCESDQTAAKRLNANPKRIALDLNEPKTISPFSLALLPIAILIFLVSGVTLQADTESDRDQRPNVLLICVDDLRPELHPTLCELTGLETPDFIDGVSLMPMLDDPATAGHAALSYKNNARTIRTATHRLVVHDDGFVELYDPESEAGETRNVADEHPELVAELKAMLDERLSADRSQ